MKTGLRPAIVFAAMWLALVRVGAAPLEPVESDPGLDPTVLSLIEVHEFKELWRVRRSEFWIATVCFLSVPTLGPLRRASRPGTTVLKEAPDGSHFVDEHEESAADAPGLIIYRFGAPLYFANATLFAEDVENVISRAASPVKWFVLDAQAMVDIDTTGEQSLRQVAARLAKRRVTFAVSRASQQTRSLLAGYHLLSLIGENRLYPTNRHAMAAFRESCPGETAAANPD